MVSRRTVLKLSAGAATAGIASLAGCSDQVAPGDGNEPTCETVAAEPQYGEWFDGVGTYRGTCDMRGEDSIQVLVGAHGGLGFYRFVPTAIAVSPGTTVRWEWTGKGGPHNVVDEGGLFNSGSPTADKNTTFEFTFETPGLYKYYCDPHRGMGMRGAVYTTTE